MEDDKIKDLFSGFQPELSPSFKFMERLERNIEAIEIVKEQNIALKRRNKVAVAIAAVSGFAMGVILTLIFPLISNWVATINIPLPHLQSNSITIDYSIVSWIVMAGVCIITSLNAYEIAMAKLTSKDTLEDLSRNKLQK